MQREAGRRASPASCTDLINTVLEDLLFGKVQLAAAKVFTVGEADAADVDAVDRRRSNAARAAAGLPKVEAAGDVGRRDKRISSASNGPPSPRS